MLKGKKVNLCSIERESLEQLRTWRNQPELRKYFREHREINSAMQNSWYEEKVLKDNNQVNFEIRDTKTDKLIGHCGLYYVHWVYRHAEFGIYIGDASYRSGGYGSDALRTLIKYGFEDLNLHRIWCEVYGNNKAIEVYKHIGFKSEGILRQNVFKNNEYLDSYILGILKEEYKNIYNIEERE